MAEGDQITLCSVWRNLKTGNLYRVVKEEPGDVWLKPERASLTSKDMHPVRRDIFEKWFERI